MADASLASQSDSFGQQNGLIYDVFALHSQSYEQWGLLILCVPRQDLQSDSNRSFRNRYRSVPRNLTLTTRQDFIATDLGLK